MYCRNCGEKLNDNDRVCPACGTPVTGTAEAGSGSFEKYAEGAPKTGPQTYKYSADAGAQRQNYEYSGPDYQGSYDSGSIGWGFLGCCIPLVGLILFLVWKDTKPKSAKSAGVGALIGVILLVVITVLFFALGIGLGAVGIAMGVEDGSIDLSELEELLDQSISTAVNGLKF